MLLGQQGSPENPFLLGSPPLISRRTRHWLTEGSCPGGPMGSAKDELVLG